MGPAGGGKTLLSLCQLIACIAYVSAVAPATGVDQSEVSTARSALLLFTDADPSMCAAYSKQVCGVRCDVACEGASGGRGCASERVTVRVWFMFMFMCACCLIA